ncbi:MAG: leucyl/phenylalanyl-tRNA--protein transferase [Treponema sp.]|jgi:leucyl/phenylalanyl-tRNA--protein transferase|nr:leucyl/phenylalanyl-tRNA--protein transferase [Treponema sp.]
MVRDRRSPGPDPDFPYLNEYQRFFFPAPDRKPGNIIAVGGNLSPGMLLSAYEQGIFPWYNQEDPILWQSPDPRFVLFPEKLHISSSMQKVFKRGDFACALDRNFAGVIQGCAEIYRPGQGGTWITGDIIAAYTELHCLGWAHSAESYQDGELVGGCYGIRLGAAFFGESMFAERSNASKAAFLTLAQHLFSDGVAFIDCQVHTAHLQSLGAEEISRRDFLRLLRKTLASRGRDPVLRDTQDRRGNWGNHSFTNQGLYG